MKSSVKILDLLKGNPRTTIPEMAEVLHLSTRAVEKNLLKLKQEKCIKRVGSARGGHWEVLK